VPNEAQTTNFLFKRALGLANTATTRSFFEEPYAAGTVVRPTQIWAQASLIPNIAPGGVDGQVTGVVQRRVNLALTPVAGANKAFYHPDLVDVIPFNTGDGSYNYAVTNSLGASIPFGSGDWLIDAGVLHFYGNLPPSLPPRVSFYRYVGAKGVPPSAVAELRTGGIRAVAVTATATDVRTGLAADDLAHPWATINAAINAGPGTVHVSPGTWPAVVLGDTRLAFAPGARLLTTTPGSLMSLSVPVTAEVHPWEIDALGANVALNVSDGQVILHGGRLIGQVEVTGGVASLRQTEVQGDVDITLGSFTSRGSVVTGTINVDAYCPDNIGVVVGDITCGGPIARAPMAANIARSGNVASAQFSSDHQLVNGDLVALAASAGYDTGEDTGGRPLFIAVTLVNATRVTFPSVGPDAAPTPGLIYRRTQVNLSRIAARVGPLGPGVINAVAAPTLVLDPQLQVEL
jgi:hypothetical protein